MGCLSTPLRFLALSPRELNLGTVCASGQSFRWQKSPVFATVHDPTPLPGLPNAVEEVKSDAEEWAFGWRDRTVVLRQDTSGLYYRSLYPPHPPYDAFVEDLKTDTTLNWIKSYFQLDTPLEPLYDQWAAGDARFKKKVESAGEGLRGIRVLKQDEWETLVSFICSANNNIARITLMVNRLCASLGTPLPHPSSFSPSTVYTSPSTLPSSSTILPPSPPVDPTAPSFFSFPPPSALTAPSTEPLLRQLGFGYRASFIPSTADTLIASSTAAGVTPEEFLNGLRKEEFVKAGKGGIAEAREQLIKFKGVGRKVGDCVLLFGLGWSETVPVDTHVFQIAIRDYSFPSTRTTSLTPALHDKVATFLASRWGPYAGWAQQVLFFADLAKPSSGSPSKKSAVYVKEELKVEFEEGEGEDGEKKRKLTFEEEVAALIATPGAKRSRRTVVQKTTVKVEIEENGWESDSSGLSSVASSPERKKVKGRAKVKKEE